MKNKLDIMLYRQITCKFFLDSISCYICNHFNCRELFSVLRMWTHNSDTWLLHHNAFSISSLLKVQTQKKTKYFFLSILWPQLLTAIDLGPVNFCQVPDSKYFRLCEFWRSLLQLLNYTVAMQKQPLTIRKQMGMTVLQ